jgi:hypothetical protein
MYWITRKAIPRTQLACVERSMLDNETVTESDITRHVMVLVRHNDGVPLTLRTLSTSGARLEGQLSVLANDHIRLLLELAGSPHVLDPQVVQVERDSFFMDRVAVRFLDLDDEVREAIRAAVEQDPSLTGLD